MKKKPSFIAGENVNYYNHFWEQFGKTLKS